MKIAVLGDFHIPSRASKIPDWIIDTLSKERVDYILCTGDLESVDVLNRLREIAPVKCVAGNMDWLDLPEHEILEVGRFKIGLIHGKGIVPRGDLRQLEWYSEKMGANILVHGHTHKLDISVYNGRLFVNPGSATGVWGGSTDGEPETMIIMIINDASVTIKKYVYGKEEVETYEWNGRCFTKKHREYSKEDN